MLGLRYRNVVDDRLRFRVENGLDMILSCQGEVQPTALSFSAKKLDFGLVAVGTNTKLLLRTKILRFCTGEIKTITLKIKNQGATDAFFQFIMDKKEAEAPITLSPEDGTLYELIFNYLNKVVYPRNPLKILQLLSSPQLQK